MFTPLVRGDHSWLQNLFPRKPGAAVYSDAWLYLTQACRGALGPLGAYYRDSSFFVGLGRHGEQWVLVRPSGAPPAEFLDRLGDFITEHGGDPIVLVKKADEQFVKTITGPANARGITVRG